MNLICIKYLKNENDQLEVGRKFHSRQPGNHRDQLFRPIALRPYLSISLPNIQFSSLCYKIYYILSTKRLYLYTISVISKSYHLVNQGDTYPLSKIVNFHYYNNINTLLQFFNIFI